MSKKGKKKSAESLEARARAHETLYGSSLREADEYRKQALNIIKKYDVRPNGKKIGAKELKIFEKRLKDFAEGKRKIKGELTFLKVLKTIEAGEEIDPNDEDEARNYQMLESLGYIKDGKLARKGRTILKR